MVYVVVYGIILVGYIVHGGWSQWTSWSSCSGGGVRSRQRVCDNPLPSNGGLDCSGNAAHQESCNTCPGKITVNTCLPTLHYFFVLIQF